LEAVAEVCGARQALGWCDVFMKIVRALELRGIAQSRAPSRRVNGEVKYFCYSFFKAFS